MTSVQPDRTMPTVPAALADAPVLDLEGREVRLGDAWRHRTVVLLFIRHFG